MNVLILWKSWHLISNSFCPYCSLRNDHQFPLAKSRDHTAIAVVQAQTRGKTGIMQKPKPCQCLCFTPALSTWCIHGAWWNTAIHMTWSLLSFNIIVVLCCNKWLTTVCVDKNKLLSFYWTFHSLNYPLGLAMMPITSLYYGGSILNNCFGEMVKTETWPESL